MSKNRPEPGVEYAASPTAEYRAASQFEAAVSLAKFLGVDSGEAVRLLNEPDALGAELRSREQAPLTGREALRQLERRFPSP